MLDDDGNRTTAQLWWGLVCACAKNSGMNTRRINARAETVHTKPSFGAGARWTGGRKLELTARIDDYATGGEIRVKMTSTVGASASHPLTLVRL